MRGIGDVGIDQDGVVVIGDDQGDGGILVADHLNQGDVGFRMDIVTGQPSDGFCPEFHLFSLFLRQFVGEPVGIEQGSQPNKDGPHEKENFPASFFQVNVQNRSFQVINLINAGSPGKLSAGHN